MKLLGCFKTLVLKANSNPQTTDEAASPYCCETLFKDSTHQSQQQLSDFDYLFRCHRKACAAGC